MILLESPIDVLFDKSTKKIERFALFAGDFPGQGGWKDLIESGPYVEELIDICVKGFYTWAHIVDLETGEIFWEKR